MGGGTRFLVVSFATVIITQRLPNIYTSTTLILVDPQKVPESYVKSTVTGDVRNRLGTLSQQILSYSRLQKIIDELDLYQEEKKKLPREEIVTKMRHDISTTANSEFGASQDLQAFRISYSGKEPRQVAKVVNQLATLFIDENLKAREDQTTETTDFLNTQLQETRKTLEAQEGKLREFKLKHIGEMPEQLPAGLQISGQLQSQLQSEGEALARAEQQRALLQSMMSQTFPVVDNDTGDEQGPTESQRRATNVQELKAPNAPKQSAVSADKAKLAELLAKGYKEIHPDIVKLRKKIAEDEAKQTASAVVAAAPLSSSATPPSIPVPTPSGAADPPPEPILNRVPSRPVDHYNPVLQAQLGQLDDEIAKHKQQQQRLSKLIAGYQAKLELIPVREQEITGLERDYGMSKVHYGQLLDKQLSAETATQLEIRMKGQKFVVLDPALPAERPTSPNRPLIDFGGAIGGLAIGLLLALLPEFRGMSIIAPRDITATGSLTVLEIIPVIQTEADRRVRKLRLTMATATAVIGTLGLCAVVLYQYRGNM